MPIIFAFHPYGGDGKSWIGKIAKVRGDCIGVYPNGIRGGWGARPVTSPEEDDMVFVDMILDALRSQYRLEAKRCAILGASNGVGVVQRMLLQRTHFKRACILSGSFAKGEQPDPYIAGEAPPGPPMVPLLQVMGKADALIPYDGGCGQVPVHVEPSEEAARMWARHAGCDMNGHVYENAAGSVRIVFNNPHSGVSIVHLGLANVGHEIAGLHDVAERDHSLGLASGLWHAVFEWLLTDL